MLMGCWTFQCMDMIIVTNIIISLMEGKGQVYFHVRLFNMYGCVFTAP